MELVPFWKIVISGPVVSRNPPTFLIFICIAHRYFIYMWKPPLEGGWGGSTSGFRVDTFEDATLTSSCAQVKMYLSENDDNTVPTLSNQFSSSAKAELSPSKPPPRPQQQLIENQYLIVIHIMIGLSISSVSMTRVKSLGKISGQSFFLGLFDMKWS